MGNLNLERVTARRQLNEARQVKDLGFISTFEEQQGFGSWFSSGLTGQLTSRLASEETQEEWFVQRKSIEFGVNQINELLNAYTEVSKTRQLTATESSEFKELQKRKDLLERDLSFVYNNFSGNLDKPIDIKGKSFNERWGLDTEDNNMLMAFLGAVKDNPAYMAGVFTSEILKDLPLSLFF